MYVKQIFYRSPMESRRLDSIDVRSMFDGCSPEMFERCPDCDGGKDNYENENNEEGNSKMKIKIKVVVSDGDEDESVNGDEGLMRRRRRRRRRARI